MKPYYSRHHGLGEPRWWKRMMWLNLAVVVLGLALAVGMGHALGSKLTALIAYGLGIAAVRVVLALVDW